MIIYMIVYTQKRQNLRFNFHHVTFGDLVTVWIL
jgi:hypothetical protein